MRYGYEMCVCGLRYVFVNLENWTLTIQKRWSAHINVLMMCGTENWSHSRELSELTFSPLTAHKMKFNREHTQKVNEFTVKIGTYHRFTTHDRMKRKKRIRPKSIDVIQHASFRFQYASGVVISFFLLSLRRQYLAFVCVCFWFFFFDFLWNAFSLFRVASLLFIFLLRIVIGTGCRCRCYCNSNLFTYLFILLYIWYCFRSFFGLIVNRVCVHMFFFRMFVFILYIILSASQSSFALHHSS